MQNSTPPSFNDLTKAELIERLKVEQEKSEAFFRLTANVLHDFRAPAANVRGYAQLLLVTPGNELHPLNETQAKYVQNMSLIADRLQKVQDFYSLALRTIQLLHELLPKEKVVLAELEVLEKQTTSGLNLLSPIDASKQAISTIMDLLNFMKSDELEVRLEDDENWVRFNFSNFTNPPYWLERNLDKRTNRLGCEESMPGYEPLCLVIALVEKQSGAVYAELGSDLTYSLSFTLPVHQEE